VVVAVIVVWGLSAIISVICERLWGFFVCRLIEYSCVLFSRRWRRSRRGMQQAALFRRERQVGVSVVNCGYCGFVVHLRLSARSAGDIGFSLCGLIEYSYVIFSR